MNQPTPTPSEQPAPTIVVQQMPRSRYVVWILFLLLLVSGLFNLGFLAAFGDYVGTLEPPHEKFHSGERTAKDKIALLEADFTIMPPYTSRFIETIEEVRDDDAVKGVVLVVDSPGGLVTDSHQIYNKLQELGEKKPIFVALKSIAASGGYYIAMGAGPEATVYAEPTTWTGSIGVIIPRYNATELGEKIGVKADSISTGALKDTLNPLKDLSEAERSVWQEIIDDAFRRFLTVIDDNRPGMEIQQIEALATGQVYTAKQALKNGLVDQIGYEKDALDAMQQKLGLERVRIVRYEYPVSLLRTLLGVSSEPRSVKIEIDPLAEILRSSVPRAMYLFGWHHGLSSQSY